MAGNDNKAFEDGEEDKSGRVIEMESLKLDPETIEQRRIRDGKHTLMGKYVEESDVARPAWDNQIQFLLACISYAVGLGNVWRFPYLAQTYGGGAFLIPYIIMLVIEGVPLFLIELAVGQRLRQGAIGTWNKFHPYLGGIGIGSMIVSALVGLYYNMIIAWCFWYLCNSFQYPLPYSSCPLNNQSTGYIEECEQSSFTEYFWYRETLDVSASIEETGGQKWWMVLCLILSWTFVWLCMIRGIESSGKVMYFTATFPYLVLTIFLIRGLTLPGASDGVAYLFSPDLSVLAQPRVWLDAATQIFFSLGLAFGGVIAFASYNPLKQDCQRDALIIALTNSFTSIYASLVIFSILGFRAYEQNNRCLDGNIETLSNYFDLPEGNITYENYKDEVNRLNTTDEVDALNLTYCDINEILSEASQGTGLAFIVFTEGIINMPGSPFWSVLFFLMLLSLGLGSMFGTIEGVVTPLCDLGIKGIPKPALTGMICLVSCVVGLLFTCGAGNYWLNIFNDYAGSIPLLVIAFFEIVAVAWLYGIKEFNEDLKWMIGRPKSIMGWILFYYFRICWVFISPVALLVVLIAFVYDIASSTLDYDAWIGDGTIESLEYPWYGLLVIYLLLLLPTLPIPVVWLYQLIRKCTKHITFDSILADKSWASEDYKESMKFWKMAKDPPNADKLSN
uniref:sodium- and chloride-dependent transporter XTRP3A-like n=1 Tax=Styela clava TaxID=7725 RepID=UPI00193A4CF1|nr:sodium- and chloride-dependent transporter XTRP3A-like [Styela clava]XP_039265172.1 sodium- and chloride-dependent transporter XTRP3A-like [Styela clava]